MRKHSPEIFAGFLPHTASLKEIHIYVESSTDVYIWQAIIESLLRKYRPADWFKIVNKIGIFHLGGSNWKHLIYTVPIARKSVIILDGNVRNEIGKVLERLREKGYKQFKLCEDINCIIESLRGGRCPVYCLHKDDILNYFKRRDLDRIIEGILNREGRFIFTAERTEQELLDIACAILSDYILRDSSEIVK